MKNNGGITLWDINVAHYATAITVVIWKGNLREHTQRKESQKPGWLVQAETRIAAIRKKLSYIDCILKCKENNQFSLHQSEIKRKLKRWYGNTRIGTLEFRQSELKHDLKVEIEKMRRRKIFQERRKINYTFNVNPKAIYCGFRKTSEFEVKKPPRKEEIEGFWSGIWHKEKQHNKSADWLPKSRENYCKDAITKKYKITLNIFKQAVNKMKNNSAPGKDLVVPLWIKKISALHQPIIDILEEVRTGLVDMPDWIATMRTILLPKNSDTHDPKNYRPIGCQNTHYKVYTSLLAHFIQNHCVSNNIIAPAQGGGKPGTWGCVDQLLINKHITNEVKQKRRNLLCAWLDYQKAYDSIPHSWILEALRLAKVPEDIIKSVERLTDIWATQIQLNSNIGSITTDVIRYLCGVIQGDTLSVLLFILSLNPLSFLLKDAPGYKLKHENQSITINHLFLWTT